MFIKRKRLRKIIISVFLSWFLLFNTNIAYALAEGETNPPDNGIVQESSESISETSPSSSPIGTSTPEPDITISPSPTSEPTIELVLTGSPISDPSPTPTLTGEPVSEDSIEATLSAKLVDEPTCLEDPCSASVDNLVIATQEADIVTKASSESTTGENKNEGEDDSLTTGDSLAVADSVVVANVNEVNSNFLLIIKDILGDTSENIDLASMLDKLMTNDLFADLTVDTTQDADITNTSEATSGTGDNVMTGESSQLESGDSVALASTTTLANINLVHSNALFVILNLYGNLVGDIIFPNWQILDPGTLLVGDLNVNTTQEADVETKSLTDSNSGENIYSGDSIQTGEATGVSTNYSRVNLVNIGGRWGLVYFNVLGGWEGEVHNLTSPGSVSKKTGSVFVEDNSKPGVVTGASSSDLDITTRQNLLLYSLAMSNANTGKNLINGDITTGNALAESRNNTFANYLGVGSSLFYGVINIHKNWNGNFVLGYPDLEVVVTDNKDQVKPGEQLSYNVEVANRGSFRAENIVIDLGLDESLDVTGSSQFMLAGLNPGETETFTSTALVKGDTVDGKVITTTALVNNEYGDENNSNNETSDTSVVVVEESSNNMSRGAILTDIENPSFGVSVTNNVNNFVYPGDTVLSKIKVKNTSGVKAYGVIVNGKLTNSTPADGANFSWDLGEMKPNEEVTIDFGFGLKTSASDGEYLLNISVSGRNEIGEEGVNSATCSFNVKYKFAKSNNIIGEVVAAEDGRVLGKMTEDTSFGKISEKNDYKPYMLALSLFAYIFLTYLKKRQNYEDNVE